MSTSAALRVEGTADVGSASEGFQAKLQLPGAGIDETFTDLDELARRLPPPLSRGFNVRGIPTDF